MEAYQHPLKLCNGRCDVAHFGETRINIQEQALLLKNQPILECENCSLVTKGNKKKRDGQLEPTLFYGVKITYNKWHHA